MKRPWFVPSPIALLCGGLLFVLLAGFGMVAAIVVPHLLELLRTSPRLAATGLLGLVVSPAIVVTIAHHVGHRALDAADASSHRAGVFPKVVSWWAGAHAWLVLYGTSVLTSLVMLVIFPPEPEPDRFTLFTALADGTSKYVGVSNIASLQGLVWVLVASQLFELERRARKRSTDA